MKDVREITPRLENAGYPLEGIATAGHPKQEHLAKAEHLPYSNWLVPVPQPVRSKKE
jgi:hypothetical protein